MALEDMIGFGVRGYKSFGLETVQFVGPMKKIHLVVGRNDVGKSNVLRCAHDVLQTLRTNSGIIQPGVFRDRLDIPRGWSGEVPRSISIGVRRTPNLEDSWFAGAASNLRPFLESDAFTKGTTNSFWFDYDLGEDGGDLSLSDAQVRQAMSQPKGFFSQDMLNRATLDLLSQSGGLLDNVKSIVSRFWRPWQSIPDMHWVDPLRSITNDPNVNAGTKSGGGLILALARLQNPDDETYESDSQKWLALNEFMRNVLDDRNARIQIPDSKNTVQVSGSLYSAMPLQNLGAGIAELIIIAAVATTISNKLICLEEPELHLHPTLQRMLIQYLHHQTDNHYLISTHSAAMLNAELASITHLTRDGKYTAAHDVTDPRSLALTVGDLGNRASDLVQSNFIVWVEGPTDRLYIADWLSTHAPELIEGAHYSIMFYGGSVLNHLAADDRETTELVELVKINRNIALVMDSDKKSTDDTLNDTKTRVIEELQDSGGMSWVTEGYTIENYLPASAIKSALTAEYPNQGYAYPAGRWKSPLGRAFAGSKTKPSKVIIARNVIAQQLGSSSWSDDLRSNVEELASKIRKANGLPEAWSARKGVLLGADAPARATNSL